MKNFYVILDEHPLVREAQSKALQEKAFEKNITWNAGKVISHLNAPGIAFNQKGKYMDLSGKDVWSRCGDGYTELTFHEALKELEKKEFKVGDWVVVLSNKNYGRVPIGTVTRIKEDGHRPYFELDYPVGERYYAGDGDLRHATPEEIAEAKKKEEIKIGNHKVEFNDESISVGCLTKLNSQWLDLHNVMKQFDLKTIQHKDGTVAKFEDIEKIVARLK